MSYRTKNRLEMGVAAFLAITVVFAASMSGAARTARGFPHAQQR
ncbi:hypothetical protein [Burkholderia sp. BCC1993]|nr:hypothetical protein [Burkholderia sp. BCC1993]